MFKLWGISKKHTITALLLGGVIALSGCGKELQEIEDYGGQTVDATSEPLSDESIGSEDSEESTDVSGGLKGDSLIDKLGNTHFEYAESITVANQIVDFDLDYQVPDVPSVPTYKITPITQASFDEDNLLKQMFGDTATALGSKDKESLNEKNGDNQLIIEGIQQILIINGFTDDEVRAVPGWIDKDGFFLHTYEGDHNGTLYQMCISYSDKFRELSVIYAPKKVNDLIDDKSLDLYGFSGNDGLLYAQYQGKMYAYNIDEVMADRPNECTLSEEEMSEVIVNTMKNDFGINLPKEVLSLHSNINYSYIVNEENAVAGQRCELIFFNKDSLLTENLEGAVRHGYSALVLEDINGLNILPNNESLNQFGDLERTSAVFVDDEGLFGAMFIIPYSFDDQVSEDATLLSFDNAMEALKKATQENLDVDQARRNMKTTIKFDQIRLMYYPLESPNDNTEYTYIPVWVVDATYNAEGGWVMDRIIINAMDGSLIDILYSAEDF